MLNSNKTEHLRSFEGLLGSSLPNDYKEFLLAAFDYYEGSKLSLEGANSEWPQLVTIQKLYPLIEEIDDDPKYADAKPFTVAVGREIYQSRQEGEGLIPSDAIVIGSCYEDGIILLLYFRGPSMGCVYLKGWMTLDQNDQDDPDANLFRLSESFEAFLRMLRNGSNRDSRSS